MSFNISFSGKNYTIDQFIEIDKADLPKWAISSQKFLKKWKKGETEFTQKTSGSTGKPKKLFIEKEQMIVSAQNTIEALTLKSGAKVLHCISSDYIGGKMLWVRALLGNWNVHLLKPKGHFNVKKLWPHYDFSAMVPLQVSNTLKDQDAQEVLNKFDQIIIGGAAVSKGLENQLQSIKATCYSTFGMTETISHIALKQLNGPSRTKYFTLVGDNEISLDNRGCLMVRGKITHNEWIQTNDLIVVKPNGFEWVGRFDLVVNTGGIKINLEEVEASLQSILQVENHSFILWKQPDDLLGERLIGISESKVFINHLRENADQIIKQLPKYHFPKRWLLCSEIKMTESGKVDRISTANEILEEFNF